MKNEIILWSSSLIIVFLIGYAKSVTSENYPITGTFGIEGKKVSYKLDKESFTKIYYSNIIISDIDGIDAKLLLKNDNSQNEIGYTLTNMGLECQILKLKPGQSIQYKIIIKHKDNTYEIPENDFVTLTFWGSVPFPVQLLNFIFLYGGLLLSVRSMLEAFTKKIHLKKFVIMNCTIFLTMDTIIFPLFNSYKLGAINHFVPAISNLLSPLLIIILGVWISAAVLIFNKKYIRSVTSLATFATFFLYFLL